MGEVLLVTRGDTCKRGGEQWIGLLKRTDMQGFDTPSCRSPTSKFHSDYSDRTFNTRCLRR